MVFAFHTMRDRVYHDVHRNTEFFAEDVVLRPPGGAEFTITVHITDDTSVDVGQFVGVSEIDKISVLISRDTKQTNIKGYWLKPVVGTQLLRDVDHDPYQEPYVYNGNVEHEMAHKWRLTFERQRVISRGPER